MNPTIPIDHVKNQRMPMGSKVVLVPDAGHQLFLDNWFSFTKSVVETLQIEDCKQ